MTLFPSRTDWEGARTAAGAEPLQPSAVLVQPDRRALRPGQMLLIALASGLAAEDVPDTERQQAAQSQAFVFRR